MTLTLRCLAVGALAMLCARASDERQSLNRALLLREQGRSAEAADILERLVLTEGLSSDLTSRSHNALGLLRRDQGRWRDAEIQFQAALSALPRDAAGCDIKPTGTGNLGEAVLQQGRLREARSLFEQALRAAQGCPAGNPEFGAIQLMNLAALARMEGQYDAARKLAETGYREIRQRLGDTHRTTVLALNNLAQIDLARGRHAQALKTMEQVCELAAGAYGEQHPLYASALTNVGAAYLRARRFAEAEASLRKSLSIENAATRELSLRTMNNLAAVLSATGRTAEARALLGRVLEAAPASGTPSATAMASLATIELKEGRADEAARLLEELGEGIRSGAIVPDALLIERLEQSAAWLRKLQRPADAERLQAEATRARTKALLRSEELRRMDAAALSKGLVR